MKKPEFVACFTTRDLQVLSILKFHLEEREIPYFVTGEDTIFLENLAIPMHEAYATLYLLPEDVDSFLNFIETGIE